jgi:MerR family transcriptional regulator, heat shock protein HspR
VSDQHQSELAKRQADRHPDRHHDRHRGVYGISVAAALVGMGVQALRLYERRGLLEPERSDGGTRRYSEEDLDRLRRIGDLLDEGLNLTGVGRVLDLEQDNARLRADNAELLAERDAAAGEPA